MEVRGDPSGGGDNKQRKEVQSSVAVQMHLRKVSKLRQKRKQVYGDEEEKVWDCEESPAEKEQPSSNTEETSGETDPEFVPNADELLSNDSSSSCTYERVTCSGVENADAVPLAVHTWEEAPADLSNLTAKEVYHTRLLTLSSKFSNHIPLEFTFRTV